MLLAASALLVALPASAATIPPADLGPQPYAQQVSVRPGGTLEVTAWTRTTDASATVVVGARWDGGEQVESFAAGDPGVPADHRVRVEVPAGVDELEVVIGQVGAEEDALLQVDRVDLAGAAHVPGAGTVTTEQRGHCSCDD